MGPAQLVVVGFDESEGFTGEILAELQKLDHVIHLVDLVFVRHHPTGELEVLEAHTPSEALVKLLGLEGQGNGSDAHEHHAETLDEDVWYLADAIPPGTAAAVALIEHRWAIPLREAVQQRQGALLAEAWVDPLDLEAVGLR